MRAARIWTLLFAVALALGACGGDEPPVDIGTEISFEVPAARGQPQTILLRGIERGSGTVGVVLAHMLNSSQTAWTPLVTELLGRGLHVLTFDFRGHGLSGGDRTPSLADLDLMGAVAKIRSLGATKVFVIGASMGGTAAVAVAAAETLEGVVTISAPVEVGGLRADEAVRKLDEPSLYIVAEKDQMQYVEAARALAAAAPEPKRLEVIRGAPAHGTDLLIDEKAGERVQTIIVEFLTDYGG
jgi:esterase/lipase